MPIIFCLLLSVFGQPPPFDLKPFSFNVRGPTTLIVSPDVATGTRLTSKGSREGRLISGTMDMQSLEPVDVIGGKNSQ